MAQVNGGFLQYTYLPTFFSEPPPPHSGERSRAILAVLFFYENLKQNMTMITCSNGAIALLLLFELLDRVQHGLVVKCRALDLEIQGSSLTGRWTY